MLEFSLWTLEFCSIYFVNGDFALFRFKSWTPLQCWAEESQDGMDPDAYSKHPRIRAYNFPCCLGLVVDWYTTYNSTGSGRKTFWETIFIALLKSSDFNLLFLNVLALIRWFLLYFHLQRGHDNRVLLRRKPMAGRTCFSEPAQRQQYPRPILTRASMIKTKM